MTEGRPSKNTSVPTRTTTRCMKRAAYEESTDTLRFHHRRCLRQAKLLKTSVVPPLACRLVALPPPIIKPLWSRQDMTSRGLENSVDEPIKPTSRCQSYVQKKMPPPLKPSQAALFSMQHRTQMQSSLDLLPTWGITDHVAYLHPRSQWDTLLHVSLHSLSLGTSTRVVQPANSAMDCQLLDIDCIKLVHVTLVDFPSFGFYPSEILQAPCHSQDFEDLLLHFVDVLRRVPFRAITPRIFILPVFRLQK